MNMRYKSRSEDWDVIEIRMFSSKPTKELTIGLCKMLFQTTKATFLTSQPLFWEVKASKHYMYDVWVSHWTGVFEP